MLLRSRELKRTEHKSALAVTRERAEQNQELSLRLWGSEHQRIPPLNSQPSNRPFGSSSGCPSGHYSCACQPYAARIPREHGPFSDHGGSSRRLAARSSSRARPFPKHPALRGPAPPRTGSNSPSCLERSEKRQNGHLLCFLYHLGLLKTAQQIKNRWEQRWGNDIKGCRKFSVYF